MVMMNKLVDPEARSIDVEMMLMGFHNMRGPGTSIYWDPKPRTKRWMGRTYPTWYVISGVRGEDGDAWVDERIGELVGAAEPLDPKPIRTWREPAVLWEFHQQPSGRDFHLGEGLFDVMVFDDLVDVFRLFGREPRVEAEYRGPLDNPSVRVRPPAAARRAAKAGLAARSKAKKSKRGGLTTQQAGRMGVGSGVARARDIVHGRTVDAQQVASFFDRHEANYRRAATKDLAPEESKAIQAWLLWGGDPMRDAARQALAKKKRLMR